MYRRSEWVVDAADEEAQRARAAVRTTQAPCLQIDVVVQRTHRIPYAFGGGS